MASSPLPYNGQATRSSGLRELKERPYQASRYARPKVGMARRRVTRACDGCKKQRTKCTGVQPCERCDRLGFPCIFQTAYTRGRPPTPPPARSSRESCKEYRPAAVPMPQAHLHHLDSSSVPRSTEVSIPPRDFPATNVSPYLGPASGVAFLSRVWQRLKEDGKIYPAEGPVERTPWASSIFAFGDKTFPDYNDDAFALPTKQDAALMIHKYFDVVAPTFRFLHQGSVQQWLNRMYDTGGKDQDMLERLPAAPMALLLTIFAETTLFTADVEGIAKVTKEVAYKSSDDYFSAAKQRLAMEFGCMSLESVQARLMQCLYLLASSRANQAWYLFGSTTQMIYAQGMHRRSISQNVSDQGASVVDECRKRTFWCAYRLDTYLSILFGRPRIFQADDIDVDYPASISDDEIFSTGLGTRLLRNDCVETAPIYLAKLACLLSEATKEIYSIKPVDESSRMPITSKYIAALCSWKASLPPVLNTVSPSSLIPIFRHQNATVRLAHAHAIMHITRPLLLRSVTEFLGSGDTHALRNHCFVQYIEECVRAAREVTEVVQDFVDQGVLLHARWFPHYIAFYAIVVLYVHSIHSHHLEILVDDAVISEPRSNCIAVHGGNISTSTVTQQQTEHFSSGVDYLGRRDNCCDCFVVAENCQIHISRATPLNSFSGRRCNIFLEELRLEICRQTGRKTGDSSTASQGVVHCTKSRISTFDADPHEHQQANADDDSALPLSQHDMLTLDSLLPWMEQPDLNSWLYAADSIGSS